MSTYHYIIGGFPELRSLSDKCPFTLLELKTYLYNHLTTQDVKKLALLFAEYDHQNLITILYKKPIAFNLLGSLTEDHWMNWVENWSEEFEYQYIPRYIQSFYRLFRTGQLNPEIMPEDVLSSLFYDEILLQKSNFLSQWYELNGNIKNVLIASISSRLNQSYVNKLVGNNKFVHALRSDSNVSRVLDQFEGKEFENIRKLVDQSDVLLVERHIDLIKWEWLEEKVLFESFDIENILAYVLKVQMLSRWDELDEVEGLRRMTSIVETVKESALSKNRGNESLGLK